MENLTVHLSDSIEALRPEWEQLERSTFPRLPFSRPDWVRLWVRHFAQRGPLLRDELRLLAVRDASGALRGLAPMVLSHRPALGPLRVRLLRMVGADPNVTELSTPLSAPGDAPAVMEALLAHLQQNQGTWDLLFFNSVRGSAASVLERQPGLRWGRESPDYLLQLPPTWDAFRGTLGRNIKQSLRKCHNSLRRDGHAFEFKVRSVTEEMAPALEHFFRLHSGRASLGGTITHIDVFALPASRRFLSDYLGVAARAGEARVFELVISGQVVASRIAFALGDQLYLYFSGFDPAWKQYSVMTTTVEQILRWAIENGYRAVNLSPGRDVSKARWNPLEIPYRQAFVTHPSVGGELVYSTYRAVRDTTGMIRRLGNGLAR